MARALASLVKPESAHFFDTLTFAAPAEEVKASASAKRINVRAIGANRVGVSFDELTSLEDVADVAEALTGKRTMPRDLGTEPESIPQALRRTDGVLAHPVFNRYHTETEMMRYLKRLENRDLSLVHAMIPLGSCTMKLNAAAELAPVSWPRFAAMHPFAPSEQARGYAEMLRELEAMLAEITGFAAVSLQPNSGAQGEYAGLLAIRSYLASRGEGARDVCLIPASAHGTNPATAQMMGLRIVVVGCDENGNVDTADLERKIAEHASRIAALMITYPSTHGVFEEAIVHICEQVHAAGGQVYMDGANMNALAGLAKPALIGADVCHINLHKTFCIPHGGGGPGMGPIAVAAHLTPFLPRHPLEGDRKSTRLNSSHGYISYAVSCWKITTHHEDAPFLERADGLGWYATSDLDNGVFRVREAFVASVLYVLSLHDALPIWRRRLPYQPAQDFLHPPRRRRARHGTHRSRRSSDAFLAASSAGRRSEEHTSELQSRLHLVCRLLLENNHTSRRRAVPRTRRRSGLVRDQRSRQRCVPRSGGVRGVGVVRAFPTRRSSDLAPTSAISTCTRLSASPTAAAGPAWDPSQSPLI